MRSSGLANGFSLRCSTMRAATLAPRRGRYASSAAVAVLMLTFFPAAAESPPSAKASAAAPTRSRTTMLVARIRDAFIENSFRFRVEERTTVRRVCGANVLIGSLRSGVLHRHLLSFGRGDRE